MRDKKYTGHTYKYTKPFETENHAWSLICPEGGIQLNVHIMDDKKYDTSAGLEYHFSFNPYKERQAPSHSPCGLLGAPCWHDGTSLYAIESVWPSVKGYFDDGNHEAIFRELEYEYEARLTQMQREDKDNE